MPSGCRPVSQVPATAQGIGVSSPAVPIPNAEIDDEVELAT
jgi:hypothetical protein